MLLQITNKDKAGSFFLQSFILGCTDFFQEFEERQMRWEHREGELERNILTMEKQTAEITGAAARVCFCHSIHSAMSV